MTHPCPFTLGQLLALYAIAHTRGHLKLAAKVLEHARQHEEEASE